MCSVSQKLVLFLVSNYTSSPLLPQERHSNSSCDIFPYYQSLEVKAEVRKKRKYSILSISGFEIAEAVRVQIQRGVDACVFFKKNHRP